MVFKKAPFGAPFRPSKRQENRSTPNDPCCPSRDPAFHEIIVISVPYGPSVFFSSHFFDKDWPISCFVCFSLCYNHNTTVHVEPLSPPIFEKPKKHISKIRYSLSLFFDVLFFTCAYFCRFSGTTLFFSLG